MPISRSGTILDKSQVVTSCCGLCARTRADNLSMNSRFTLLMHTSARIGEGVRTPYGRNSDMVCALSCLETLSISSDPLVVSSTAIFRSLSSTISSCYLDREPFMTQSLLLRPAFRALKRAKS
jgi:hypothetical protein